jgi:uncharacterized membrane protein YagU involved in acid resistance
MVISFLFGVAYTLIAGIIPLNAVVSGTLYGVLLWALFPFTMMPMMMGMTPFQFTSASMMSLMGHVVYGLITGIVYKKMTASIRPELTKNTDSK